MRILIASLGLLLLASCGSLPQVAGGVTAAVVPAAELSQLQATCTAAGPILSLATATGAPSTVRSIAQYAQAYCGQLAGGTTPVTTDGNTPAWLSSVLNATQIAAQVAGLVLPLVSLF